MTYYLLHSTYYLLLVIYYWLLATYLLLLPTSCFYLLGSEEGGARLTWPLATYY